MVLQWCYKQGGQGNEVRYRNHLQRRIVKRIAIIQLSWVFIQVEIC